MGGRTLPRAWHTLNTDFPNYYLTARLQREGYDTSRVYEWVWLQRQKDHRDIDQRIVGMVPITPFSTLAVWPLASMPPLKAKHCWLIANCCLLLGTVSLLRSLTALPWRNVFLLAAFSLPLHANFLLGQYYVLLLFLLTLSGLQYIRAQRFVSGVLAGVATGLKVFPAIYLLYFLRKRDFRALAGGLFGAIGTVIVSVWVFGWQLHRTYLLEVLPAVLRGEGLDPYNLRSASLASLLHRLFIFEPQLNPQPAIHAPWLFAVFHPLLQMALVAPALLRASPGENSVRRLRLEWAAILLASLAVSTSPSSYLFTLLILPAGLLWKALRDRSSAPALVFFVLLVFAGVGLLGGDNAHVAGWNALLKVPRLYAVVVLCVIAYAVMVKEREYLSSNARLNSHQVAWATLLSMILVLNITANIRHQRNLYSAYAWRIPLPSEIAMAVGPSIQGDRVRFIGLFPDGYHDAMLRSGALQFSETGRDDRLAVTASRDEAWVEASGRESTLISSSGSSSKAERSESPVVSPDGRWLAFLRPNHGRGRVWLRSLSRIGSADRAVTSADLNVLEMSFLSDGNLVFAARSGGAPGLFRTDEAGGVFSLGPEAARYPAVSPDGRWLAYSQLNGGNWNIWLRDLDHGYSRRLTDAACNDVQPAWTPDSKSLIYGSDCGRGLWFTALCRRRVIP